MSSLKRDNALTITDLELGVSLLAGVFNEDGTEVDATGATGEFAKSAGGFGSGTLELLGQQASGVTKTDTLMIALTVPDNFQKAAYSTGSKALKIKIKHKTDPVATTTASIDVEAYESDGEGGISGSDIVTTTAITHNSLTWTEHEFTITPTNLEPGDDILILIQTIVDDASGATNARSHIGKITLEYAGKM